MIKNKRISVLLLLIAGLLLAACSNDNEQTEESEPADTEQTETDTSEEGAESESADEAATEEEDESSSNDAYIEHQLGLNIGDTATVVSSSEKYKYEVTVNELQFQDELGNVPSYDNKFLIANVTVKNIDDRSFSASAIFEPGVGVQGSNEYKPPVDAEILQNVSGIELFEGELAPEDSITGDYVFRIEEADNYNLAFGIESDQITTRAEWEFSAKEIQ
ncbi:DUF4352 domain-containing protein [Oceanobacillus sp. CFH 90083]|uniref:DUF4352 domain-containing protein n=1 Tax=Oceanobacillus sp. CFH 90083 TaxID=2592336 RepID=UPI00128BE1B1|nr:DUF4352 domain-containing protein [Oceanobacillus sp. CFH 90083]